MLWLGRSTRPIRAVPWGPKASRETPPNEGAVSGEAKEAPATKIPRTKTANTTVSAFIVFLLTALRREVMMMRGKRAYSQVASVPFGVPGAGGLQTVEQQFMLSSQASPCALQSTKTGAVRGVE